MRFKFYSLLILVLVLLQAQLPLAVGQSYESKDNLEYKIKAAFIYNFIKFIDWQDNCLPENNNTITIGLLGKSPFNNSFEPITKKKVKNKKVTIKYFPEFEKMTDKTLLKKCHVLFICDSEKKQLKDVINAVKDSCVLTVGEMDGLLKAGGIIKFSMHKKKVRFEVNLTAAKRAKLEIRSQLLRLAKKVVKPSQNKGGRN